MPLSSQKSPHLYLPGFPKNQHVSKAQTEKEFSLPGAVRGPEQSLSSTQWVSFSFSCCPAV